ncbi:MAG: Inositol 2-dehydrogenase [candidate division BRC1 bacterium ADurb.BinA364]|nr:MAG: Inositol 2-dehydrogenase [candidate division BRC1 bacterium ADurb.BinA364]
MAKLSRRAFVKTAGLAGAAFFAPAIDVLGANEEIRVAVCGVNGKGMNDARQFSKVPGVKLVALCDPDSAVLEKRIAEFAKGESPLKLDGHKDFREVLDRKDIDAVCIATPNHWHSLMAILAIQAGKDVYVEKPLSHGLWEGRKVIEAARKYNRIVQVGTQNRSDVGLMEFYPWMLEGNIGKVVKIRGLCYKERTGIGKLDKPLTPPDSLDYNLWLGPGQDEPIYRKRIHYDWHWSWNTGNGDIGNQGPHEFDLLRWAMGDQGVPTRVTGFGGRFAWDDAGETPNMQFAAFDYNGIPALFEVRDLYLKPELKASPNYAGIRIGVVITCEGGEFRGGRGGGWVYDNNGEKVRQFKGDGGGGHQANFIDAMRSRKIEDLNADVEKGHLSACMFHMANTSFRLGQSASPGALKEMMAEDKDSLEAIERFGAQLADWNIDLEKTPWTAGVSLAFDPQTERYTGDGPIVEQANAMLRREYRKPFVVPDAV